METKAVGEFFTEVGKYPNMWNSVELKAVVANKFGEPFRLVGLRGTLSEDADFSSEVLFETPDIVIVTERKPIRELQQLLDGLTQGEISIKGKALKVEGFSSFRCVNFAAGKGWDDTEYPYILLDSTGKSVSEIVELGAIEGRLLSWGYHSLEALTREKVGFPVGGSYSITSRIVAPILLHAEASFVNDSLRLALRWHHSLKANDISASYEVGSGTATTQRGKFQLGGATQGDQGLTYSVEVEAKLPQEAQRATIWVFHPSRSDPLYSLVVAKEPSAVTSPVWTALRLVLSKRESGQVRSAEQIMEGVLGFNGDITDLGRFESAIHNLLACCGYSCLFTGHQWGAQGIDSLAFNRTVDKLVAISVTTSNDIGEKVRTLLPMLKKLRDGMPKLCVVGAVFAPVEPNLVLRSDKGDAESEEIRLVLKPQLKELWDTLRTRTEKDAEVRLESFLFSFGNSPF